jgi:hypothetical protein
LVVLLAVSSLLDRFGVIALPETLSATLRAAFLIFGVIVLVSWFSGYGNRDAPGAADAIKGEVNG